MAQAVRLQRGGAFKCPCLTPDRAWENRAGPFRLPIARRDHIVKSFAKIWIALLGPRRGDIDANLPHRSNGIWVQLAGFGACAHDLELITNQIAKKSLSHLGAARILCTKK